MELLTLSGSKPTLSATGEGITSIKTSLLFKVGITGVKPFDPPFKVELPVGYTLYNNLIYRIETEAVFSGPNDFLFRIPSATTKETFNQLRVLYAERDPAEPDKPIWIDATLLPESNSGRYLTQAEYDKRAPDFKSRTLHAFMEQDPAVLIVATKDSALTRDNFLADLSITGTAPEEVMEGREVTYSFKVTNNGPDPATGIDFHADPTFDFISVTASQDKCRMEASNVYCKFARLEKGQSISIKIVEKPRWGLYENYPPGYSAGKNVQIGSGEGDPSYENNTLSLDTAILTDPNKAPVAEITSPKMFEVIPGPEPTVIIVAKASDPDGFVKEIEFFDEGQSIGKGTLLRADEYQLTYEKAPFGRHWMKIKVTDNLGRETIAGPFEYFVNGLAQVEITSPTEGSRVKRSDRTISVTVKASHPKHKIKEVTVGTGSLGGSNKARLIGNDTYEASIYDDCKRNCQVSAEVLDDSGVVTRAQPINFKMTEPPEVTLYQYDGEYVHKMTEDKPFDPGLGFVVRAHAQHEDTDWEEVPIVKIDFFANGKLFDNYTRTSSDKADSYVECELSKLQPGTYKLQAVATDSDGSVGRSALVEMVIKPR